METKELKFEELSAEHLFLFCDIIEAIGLEQFAETFKEFQGTENTSIGFSIASVLVKGLKKAKEPIYRFFSGCTNYEYEEVSNMKLVPFTRMIKQFTEKPELADFLKEVMSFLNMEK